MSGYGVQRNSVGRPRGATYGMTSAEKAHARNNRNSAVPRGEECADWRRRRRLEANPARWLRYYLAETYSRRFDRPHREIIAGAMHAHETGGRFVVAAERGVGKSACMYGLVLYLALTGRRRFPVYLPWAANVMRRGLQFWRAALSFNERILADYRWHAAPFAVMRGYSNRLRAAWWQEQDGDQTGPPCGAALKITDGMIVLPDNRGVIGGATINGNPRGLNLPQSDGTVLRPDLALVDDPQDRKVAKSPVLVSETCAKIDGDVAGLGTAGAPFPLLMSGNCVLAGDVMERYIADANWRALRVSCVETWPTGWADKGPTYRLWSDWWDAYQADAKAGAAFYKANRKAMVTGMALSAPHAYKAQRSSLLPDEFCVAMRQYWQMGHEAFMAERQQSPVTIEASAALVVQPEQVLVRAVGPPRGRAPEGALRIVAGADINPGLQSRLGPRVTWAVLAFAREQVACVIAYGRERIVMPADPTQAQSAAASFAAIEQVRLKVAAVGADVLFYDARGNWSPRGLAIRYAMQRTPGIAIVPAEGWSNEYYRPTHKTAVRRFEGGHECADVVDGVRVRWIAWNADHWGEAMLRGWLAVPGAPGACVLYAGEQEHEFAEQVTMKRLVGKLATSKGIRYDWADRPGDQDYGDAVAMCWAAAAWGGIGTGGVVRQRRYVETRQCKVKREN